jgi:hypothetical protein
LKAADERSEEGERGVDLIDGDEKQRLDEASEYFLIQLLINIFKEI